MNRLAATDGGDGPLIQWSYVLKGKRHTAEDISTAKLPYNDWLNTVVEFKPIDLTPKMNFADPSSLNSASQSILVKDDEDIEDYWNPANDTQWNLCE